MDKLLQVLVIDNSENDTQLLLEEIRRNHYEPVFQRVQNAADFTSALGRQAWDVIVSDYSLPGFSGSAALKLLRQRHLDIPFIVVSGTYGEDAAVEVMKAGADDFVVKENLSRLVPAIERGTAAAQTRRARTHAETARRFLAAIVESSEDAIYGKTPDGTIVSWNRGAERTFGYRSDEIIGRSIGLLYPGDRQDEFIHVMERIRRGEYIGRYESMRRHKDGQAVPVSLTVSPIRNDQGEIIGASTIARDITARRHDEQERLKLIRDLTEAVARVKTLSGLLPICSGCKRIRDDDGRWRPVETYVAAHSDALFTHSLCPNCADQFEPQLKFPV